MERLEESIESCEQKARERRKAAVELYTSTFTRHLKFRAPLTSVRRSVRGSELEFSE